MKKFLAVAVIAAMTLLGGSAFAYDVKIDDDTFAKVGVKAQTRILMLEDAAATGTDPAIDITVPNARIYFSGQVTNLVKFGFNFDMARAAGGTQGTSLADGSVMLDFAKELKVMVGVYRMAVSRVGLEDSYTYILPDAPLVAGAGFLSNGYAGYRNAGVTLWGDLIGGMIRYNVGLWDGSGNATAINNKAVSTATPPVTTGNWNPEDSLGMSGRLVFNFLDPEKGYTCLSCYLGKAKILNIGLGYLTQAYGAGTGSVSDKTYTVTTVDAFYDANNVTAEAGYFMYDYDTAAGNPTGMFLQGAYVIGNIQPALRYELWDADAALAGPGANSDYSRITVGANYLMDAQNAKVSLAYMMHDWDTEGLTVRTQKDYADLTLQLQVQF